MSSDDFRAYLAEEQQKQAVARRFNDMLRDPEEENAATEQAVEFAARDQIAQVAEEAVMHEDGFTDMIVEARDLRRQIANGDLTTADAKTALLTLRQKHGASAKSLGALRPAYESATKSVRAPGARRDELIEKYGL